MVIDRVGVLLIAGAGEDQVAMIIDTDNYYKLPYGNVRRGYSTENDTTLHNTAIRVLQDYTHEVVHAKPEVMKFYKDIRGRGKRFTRMYVVVINSTQDNITQYLKKKHNIKFTKLSNLREFAKEFNDANTPEQRKAILQKNSQFDWKLLYYLHDIKETIDNALLTPMFVVDKSSYIELNNPKS